MRCLILQSHFTVASVRARRGRRKGVIFVAQRHLGLVVLPTRLLAAAPLGRPACFAAQGKGRGGSRGTQEGGRSRAGIAPHPPPSFPPPPLSLPLQQRTPRCKTPAPPQHPRKTVRQQLDGEWGSGGWGEGGTHSAVRAPHASCSTCAVQTTQKNRFGSEGGSLRTMREMQGRRSSGRGVRCMCWVV